jgi:archaellum biogenesis ATPase FlaH
MRLGKEICKEEEIKGKDGAMLEMITSKMTIDLKVLSLLMKNRIVSSLNRTLVVTIHRSRMRKENFHISN